MEDRRNNYSDQQDVHYVGVQGGGSVIIALIFMLVTVDASVQLMLAVLYPLQQSFSKV